jgi:hypothetical protein
MQKIFSAIFPANQIFPGGKMSKKEKNRKENHVRLLIYPLLAIALCAFSAACCKPLSIGSIGVSLTPQHRDFWCWAATTETISAYFGHRIDQCRSANFVHGTPPECCSGCSGDCACWGDDWAASITDIKNNWTHWGFTFTHTASSLEWNHVLKDDIRDTISSAPHCKKCPIQVIWWWYGGGGHVVTAYGYADNGTSGYVSYLDPLPADCEKTGTQCGPATGGDDVVSTYEAFVDDGIHKWGDTFYNFKYTGK